MKANLRTDYLAACAMFADVGTGSRYYLQGVHVMPWADPATGTGALMIATDGHTMGIFYDREGYAEAPATLALDWKAKELKRGASWEDPRYIEIDGAAGTIRLGSDYSGQTVGMMLVGYCDGTFPDWTRMLPQESNAAPSWQPGVAFNAPYLDRFMKAAKRAGFSDRSMPMHMMQPEKSGPAWARFAGFEDAVFIIMPHRGDGPHKGRPEWLGAEFPARRCAEQIAAE